MRVRPAYGVGFVALTAFFLAACAMTKTVAPTNPAAPIVREVQPAPTTPAVSLSTERAANQIHMAEILDDPKKMAVMQKYAPTLAANPRLSMARGMTLADVAGYAEAGLNSATLKSIVDAINRL